MRLFARKANQDGGKLLEQGDYAAAEQKFIKATRQAPDWSAPWYNLGLVYKWTRNWQKSLESNKRAVQLDPENEAAWWNLGIAATALSNWPVARQAWTQVGVQLPDGVGPIELNLGLTPIRLNPETSGEVVWCDRIDPARAIIRNVPLLSSNHRFGDLILHDGQANGYRQLRGEEVPVFDELGLLKRSPFATFEIVVEAGNQADRDDLAALAAKRELAIEDWSTIRLLCHLCSLGRPHSQHEPQTGEDGPLVRYGAAARQESDVRSLFEDWLNERVGCSVLTLSCVLPHDG